MKNVFNWPSLAKYLLPADVVGLPTLEAESWFLISSDPTLCFEEPAFDWEGNLYVCVAVPPPGPVPKIVKISPDKIMTDFYISDGSDLPCGLAIHPDGRIFAVSMFGGITIINPDGSLNRHVATVYDDGSVANPNDCVFDEHGNLYFTDYRGHVGDLCGAVARLDADSNYTHITRILGGLAMPNGISFSPDFRMLWVSESNRNTLMQIHLTPEGGIPTMGESVNIVYYSTGLHILDGNKVDAEGNCYQAMMRGGRVLIFNPDGIPIGNVVVPRREEGVWNNTPNLIIKPKTQEAYLLASGVAGLMVMRFPAWASAQTLYFQMNN